VTILPSAFEVKILPKQNAVYASRLLQFKPLEAPGVIEGAGGGVRGGVKLQLKGREKERSQHKKVNGLGGVCVCKFVVMDAIYEQSMNSTLNTSVCVLVLAPGLKGRGFFYWGGHFLALLVQERH
jgi:hypothetical protein